MSGRQVYQHDDRFDRPGSSRGNNGRDRRAVREVREVRGRDRSPPGPPPVQLASGVQVVENQFKVDRAATCPFLLRMFPTTHRHRDESTYRDGLPKSEVLVHTWFDCTLRELVELLKTAQPQATRGVVSFRRIFPQKSSGRFVGSHLGQVHSSRRGFEDDMTLKELGFEIGDYIDVCVFPDRS